MGKRAFIGASLVVGAFAFAVVPRAHACEHCESRIQAADIDRRVWPRPGVLPMMGSGLGMCWRQDANVKWSGACSDLFFGVDWALPLHVRLLFEGGFVVDEHQRAGLIGYGTSYVAGGVYVGARLLLGYDFTRLFFGRVGPEIRTTGETGLTAAWVAELGTRVLGHVEVGLRAKVGADSVSAENDVRPELAASTVAFAQSTMIFVRVFP